MPTTITISEFQPGPSECNFTGTTCKLRRYYDSDWLDVDNVWHTEGTVGSSTSFFDEINCTLAGNTITVPSFLVTPTDNALVGTPRETWQLWDQSGAARNVIFEGFIPSSPSTTTHGALLIANQGQTLSNPPNVYLNSAGVQALINVALGIVRFATSVIAGWSRLSVAAANTADPIAKGDNDPLVLDAKSFASLATAISDIGSTPAVLNISDTQTLSGDLVIPSTLQLNFVKSGQITGAHTLTVNGPITAPRTKIFGSTVTVLFTSNLVQSAVYPEWWGTTATAMQAALTAAGTISTGGTVRLASVRYTMNAAVTMPANTRLIGNGYASELFFESVTPIPSGLGANDVSNLEIGHLRVTGSTATPTISRGIYINGGTNHRIHDVFVSGANVTAVSGPLAGIGIVRASDVWVTDCEFTGNGNVSLPVQSYDLVSWDDGGFQPSGIHFLRNRIYGSSTNYSSTIFNANDSEFVGNIVDQNNKANETTSSGYGIAFYGASFTGNRNRIANNTIANSGGTGIYAVAMNYVQVENNILLNNALQQTTGSLARGGIAIDGSAGAGLHCAIVGNIVTGSGQHGITYPTSSFGTITGNTIKSPVLSGINVPSASDTMVSANAIELPGDVGIYALIGFTRSRITGNTIRTATAAGIDVTSATDFGVNDNTVTNCGASGITVRATSLRGSVSHNQLKGNGTSNVLFPELAVNGTNLTVSTNTLLTAAVTNGLDTSSATDSVFDHNIVTGYTNGIVDGGTRNLIESNRLAGNTNPFSGAANAMRRGNWFSTGATQGTAVLIAGAKTVNTAEVKAGDTILLSNVALGGTAGFLTVGAIVAGTSFVIQSSNGADTSTIFWQIVH